MLEVGWSEILVIALILIIVVGPKDLPGMLRNFGRMASRVRKMANEFKGQFDEALREAELDDVRKGISEVNKLNPASSLRDAMNPIRQLGQDIKSDLKKASDFTPKADEGTKPAELAADPVIAPTPVVAPTPVIAPSPVIPLSTAVTPSTVVSEPVAVAEPVVEKPARKRTKKAPDSTALVANPPEVLPVPVKAPRTRKKAATETAVVPEAANDAPAKPKKAKRATKTGDA